jgi:hypothetical protein
MPSFNLSTFRRKVHSVARNQYFAVRIPQVADEDTITALAVSTTLPPKTHDTTSIFYRGLGVKIQTKPTFGEWSVDFLCDEAHSLRNIFKKWMELQYNVQTLTNANHNEYKVDGVSVSQLAANKAATSTTTFYGMFPKTVGEIALNQEGGEVEKFTVTFDYDYHADNDLDGDVVFNEVDVLVGNDGIFEGATIAGVAGINFKL